MASARLGSGFYQPTSSRAEPSWWSSAASAASTRTTFDLVQSCIFTLIVCSWTAVHPDIPPHNRRHRWIYNKLFATLWAIVMPEYFLWMAFDELWESRLICKKLKEVEEELGKPKSTMAEGKGPPDEKPTAAVQSVPDSKDMITDVSPENPSHASPETHGTNDQDHNLNAHGASMGETDGGLWHKVSKTWRNVFPTELERGFYIEMGGYEIESPLAEGLDLPEDFGGRVTARGAIELYRHDLLPEVTTELINDQSKFDMLTKVLFCLQAGWMIIQCIARVHQSLPLTLLEVHTLIYAVCAFFIHCLWLKKPHDVMVTTKVPVDYEKLKKLRDIAGNIQEPGFSFIEQSAGSTAVKRSSCRLSQSNNSKSPISRSIMTYLAYPIYGGAHLAVWNTHFPSNVERILWIASALSIMVLPPLQDVLERIAKRIGELVWKGVKWLAEWLVEWIVNRFFKKLWSWKGIKGLLSGEGMEWFFVRHLRELINGAIEAWNTYQCISHWGAKLLSIGEIGIATCWFLARAYLLVESCASLRSLPLGSHISVNWVSYIPHL